MSLINHEELKKQIAGRKNSLISNNIKLFLEGYYLFRLFVVCSISSLVVITFELES